MQLNHTLRQQRRSIHFLAYLSSPKTRRNQFTAGFILAALPFPVSFVKSPPRAPREATYPKKESPQQNRRTL